MWTLEQWLTAYAASHQHPVNMRIHRVAVPGIYLSIVGFIWSLPPLAVGGLSIDWIWLVAMPVMLFYLRLSLTVFLMMLGFTLACASLAWCVAIIGLSLPACSLGLFTILWVAQFVGHHIEGQRPAFFTDLQFLLIGPVWVFYHNDNSNE